MAQPLPCPPTPLIKSVSANEIAFSRLSTLSTDEKPVPASKSVDMPPHRPISLASATAFTPYTPPNPPPNSTPLRRPASAYLSCMVPAGSRGSLPRRPTSLYESGVHGCVIPRGPPPFSVNTWNSVRRPHGLVNSASLVPASPSDSGYRSLTSSVSDHQLSDPRSALAQLRPRPSPSFHGLPSRPFNCGISPSGTPLFLGCTHIHGSFGGKPRTITPTTSNAIRQMLLQPRNGFHTADEKISLFFEILDSQHRFAQVTHTST